MIRLPFVTGGFRPGAVILGRQLSAVTPDPPHSASIWHRQLNPACLWKGQWGSHSSAGRTAAPWQASYLGKYSPQDSYRWL